jgi:hypothetical protein
MGKQTNREKLICRKLLQAMELSLYELLNHCTAKLIPAKSKVWGTGFFVAKGKIITCAHVVQDHETEAISVLWQGREWAAKIESIQHSPVDLALLQVELSDEEHPPCVLLDEGFNPFDHLYVYGYPDDFPEGSSVTITCEGIAKEHGVTLIKAQAGLVRPGHSGSPALNKQTGKVCGIVSETRSRSTDLGGLLIPVSMVFRQFPELQEQNREILERDKDFSIVWRQNLRRERAVKSLVTKDQEWMQRVSRDMCELSLAAELRLTTEDSNYRESLRLAKRYAKALGRKNHEGLQLGETFEVRRSDISTSNPEEYIDNELGIWLWKVDLLVSLDTNIIVQWGRAFVNVLNGKSELLLDNRPTAWIGSLLEIRGIKVKEFIPLYDEDFRLTEAAIVNTVLCFHNFYGGKYQIRDFGGWLKDTNLRDFKKFYEEIKSNSCSVNPKKVAQDALRRTSFGRSRVKLGIRNFAINLEFHDTENPDIPSEVLVTNASVADEDQDEHLMKCKQWKELFTSSVA